MGRYTLTISNIFTQEHSTSLFGFTIQTYKWHTCTKSDNNTIKGQSMIMSYMHRDSTVQSSNNKGYIIPLSMFDS